MKFIKKILICLMLIFGAFLVAHPLNNAYATSENPINVYLFHGETCPHCKRVIVFLKQIKDKYSFNVKDYEVYYNKENQKLMERFAKAYNTEFIGVPVLIIGKEFVEGEDPQKIELLINQYSSQLEYEDPYNIVLEYEQNQGKNDIPVVEGNGYKRKVFGLDLNLEKVGPFLMGALLGVADGINPCMFSVIIFLLSYLLSVSSKKKVLISGVLFIATVFLTYTILMFGVFKVMSLIPYIGLLKTLIGIVAILMGLIMIKDFFFYDKWFSLKIPDKFKPAIENITLKGTYVSAILLGLFSSIVELPCTIGIPMAYITAVRDSGANIITSLIIYNLFFIVPVSIIVFTVYFASNKVEKANKTEEFRNKYKRYMRLLAGVILLVMGIGFLTRLI